MNKTIFYLNVINKINEQTKQQIRQKQLQVALSIQLDQLEHRRIYNLNQLIIQTILKQLII